MDVFQSMVKRNALQIPKLTRYGSSLLWLGFGVNFRVCYRQELLGKELGHERVNSCRVDQRYEGHVRPLSGQHQGLPRLREKKTRSFSS